MNDNRQFGSRIPGAVYVDRPSAYAVVFQHGNRVLAVEHGGRYFLPGGGLDPGESCEEALYREVVEELGWKVSVGALIGAAGEYVDVPKQNKYVNKIGQFYLCELVDSSGTDFEEDHSPKWVTLEEFISRAAHESHVWAVRVALKRQG